MNLVNTYQILIRTTTDHIRNITTFVEPYGKIIFTLNVASLNIGGIFEIGIRGVDHDNNAGEWSSLTEVDF